MVGNPILSKTVYNKTIENNITEISFGNLTLNILEE